MTDPAYDPISDFAPIAALATIPFVMDLGPAVQAQTVKEFVDYASFARLNADELDRWRRVVKSANIKVD